jgi:uncharacterized membrane protein YkoI
MILKNMIKNLEESKIFLEFKKSNPEYYLAHCFTMLDEKEKKYEWELGYYSSKKDKLVVFETVPEVRLRDEDDAFTRENIIKHLDMKQVKVSLARALELCDEVTKKNYPAHAITKRIIILQNIDRPVYNITLVMRSFSVLNIKIDAASGEVVSHNLHNLMDLGRWEKGERNSGEDNAHDAQKPPKAG